VGLVASTPLPRYGLSAAHVIWIVRGTRNSETKPPRLTSPRRRRDPVRLPHRSHHANQECGAGYPDRKIVLLGTAAAGPLRLRVPTAKQLVLCNPPLVGDARRRRRRNASRPLLAWQEGIDGDAVSLAGLLRRGKLDVEVDGVAATPEEICSVAYLGEFACLAIPLPGPAAPRSVSVAVRAAGAYVSISHVLWSHETPGRGQERLCRANPKLARKRSGGPKIYYTKGQ